METGHETAFEVHRDFQGSKTYWTSVLEGGCDKVDAFTRMIHLFESEIPDEDSKETIELLNLHFHPGYKSLDLSDNDFRVMDDPDGRPHVWPISAIGVVDDSGNGFVTMMQKRVGGFLYDTDNDLLLQTTAIHRPQDSLMLTPTIYKSLALPGYLRSGALRFAIGNGANDATIKNAGIMRRFAYRSGG